MSSDWPDPGLWLDARPLASIALLSTLLLAAAWLANWLTRRVLLRGVERVVRATPAAWDDALLERGVLDRVANLVPALVIYLGVPLLPELADSLARLLRNLALAWMILALALALSKLLSALNTLYERRAPERARARPIKGYLQLLQLLLYLLSAVLVVAVLIERSPWLLLSGLGAATAVLMLVFKDTLMSLVASVQLASHDLLRVGDWIEMPALGVDGEVIEIALHSTKVQNWDKSITSIPTHRLMSDSFRNWRGMSDAGGRRIKRALLIDQRSVHFLRDDERGRLARFALIEDYLDHKRDELARWNESLRDAALQPVNTRRLTNLGTFRAYTEAYLRAHPRLRQDLTLLVRQLSPTPSGLPLEIYCFTATTQWAEFEQIQADIFDHLLAILAEFDLQLFQEPGGADLRAALAKPR